MINKGFKLCIKQYCLMVWSAGKNTENKIAKVIKIKNGRIMLTSKCAILGVKNQD